MGEGIKRILVVRPDHLGDLLFATPALHRLRQGFPNAHITGAVGPWGKAMWEDNHDLNALDVFPFPGIAGRAGAAPSTPLTPYLLLGKAAARLASESYDLAILLRFDHWWGAAMLWAAGVPARWGYSTAAAGGRLTHVLPYAPGRHEVEQSLALVEAVIDSTRTRPLAPLHVSRDEGRPPLVPPPPEPLAGEIAAEWLGSRKRVAIHPGTGAANKLWTVAGWARVIEWLAEEGWSVALTGSPGERPLAEAIEAEAGLALTNLAGRTASLRQLAWTLDRAAMTLGVDSGPLHIAAALGKPTLHLYGPSDESIWGPWGDPSRHVVLRAPGTRPAMALDVGSREIEGGPEMRAITPEMVIERVRSLPGYLAGA
jgi:heptosyltransferase-2/heptosyltransferase-3